ncbi:MAG: hypothetical protein MUE82_12690, partial [Chloroflexi bacterium]|nr:hypothetical protein [Chloroflexota bacterium]
MRITVRGSSRPAAALVALSLLVGASVGRCDLPQPKFPTLGSMDARAWVAGSMGGPARSAAWSIAWLATRDLRGAAGA